MTYEPSKLIITFSTPKTHVEKHETMITMIKINCTSFRVVCFKIVFKLAASGTF